VTVIKWLHTAPVYQIHLVQIVVGATVTYGPIRVLGSKPGTNTACTVQKPGFQQRGIVLFLSS